VNILRAVVYLALACLVGLLFVSWGIYRGDTVPIPLFALFWCILVFASPFWLLVFLPLYLCVAPKSLFWRLYVAPPLGALIGLVAGLMAFGAHFDTEDATGIRISLAPAVIGLTLFLFGTISKIRTKNGDFSN